VPNRPTRPGKHVARHKAPSAFSRATARVTTPTLPSLGVRRTGGTVIALGAVVLAGAAGSGATSIPSRGADVSSASRSQIKLPSAHATAPVAQEQAERVDAAAPEVSRSLARAPLAQEMAQRRDHAGSEASRSAARTSAHTARAQSVVPEDPREIAESMLAEYGWDSSEMSCLDELWVSESDWDVNATNPTSGAYGIPQALPAEKMATAGSDWRTNPKTQIEWGLDYIESSYGTPCSAWEFKQANDWY
jgi:hypothetical protein